MSTSVRVTTLPGGLKVATDTMSQVESVSVGAWIGVGARHEPAAINGVAHMLEHMAFKGTEKRSALEIAEEIEAVGGYLNAYTGREQTAYYAKVLSADVPLAVDILGDILQRSVFDPAEIERERQVILQEIGQAEDTPDDIIFDHFQAAAFPGQAIGRPVLGSAEIVGALKRDEITGYMQSHYGIGTMIVSAAGKIEHEALVDLVGRHFGELGPSERPRPEPAAYAGGDHRDERDLEQAHVALGFQASAITIPTTTRCRCSRRFSAAARRPASSRRCGRSAALHIRSIPSPPPSSMAASSASTPGPRPSR